MLERRTRAALLFGATWAAALCAAPAVAHAQNTESFFFSDDAALMAGAVVGRPAEAAGAWYNPASLGALERPRVVVNGSVFGLRFRKHPDALVTEAGDRSNRLALDSTTYIATPTGVTASFSLFPWLKLGGGLYTTEREIEDATDDAVTHVVLSGVPTELTQRVHYQIDRKKMVAGGSFGIKVTDRFRIGSGLFGTYTTLNAKAQLMNEVATSDPLANVLVLDIEGDVSAICLQPTVGAQWDVTDDVHLGVTVYLSEIVLTSSSNGGATTIVVTRDGGTPIGGIDFARAEGDEDDEPTVLSRPKVALGAAFDVSKDLVVGLGVEAVSGIQTDAFGLDRKGVINARAGVRYQLIPELALGAGLFTDLASERRLGDGLGSRRLDYFGATLGGSLMTPVLVVDRDPNDPVIIATTVAVRYAIGVGQARTLRITDDALPVGGEASIVAHDLMPYLGTSISL